MPRSGIQQQQADTQAQLCFSCPPTVLGMCCVAGLGALVVRRSLLPLLQQHKAYFGGGTVEVASPDTSYVVR